PGGRHPRPRRGRPRGPARGRGRRGRACRRARPRALRPRAGRAARRRSPRALPALEPIRGAVCRADAGSRRVRSTLNRVRADELKQLLKNGVYRSLGEVASTVGVDGVPERSLRVLMYHKVNDVAGNSVTVPVGLFDEQMAQLGEFGYTPVSLDAVLDHYLQRAPLPDGAVLITFDDGYRDNLENAVPVLQRYGYPAVLFCPIGYLGGRRPLPHDEHLASQGIVNRTLDWSELAELENAGVRIESHGIGHRPL